MGVTLQDQGKLEKAIVAHNKAISLKPNFADAYYNMGNVLKDQGKLYKSIEAYKKAISLNLIMLMPSATWVLLLKTKVS